MPTYPVGRTVEPAAAIANPNYEQNGAGANGTDVNRAVRGSSNARYDANGLVNFDNPPVNAVVRNPAPITPISS